MTNSEKKIDLLTEAAALLRAEEEAVLAGVQAMMQVVAHRPAKPKTEAETEEGFDNLPV
jgi:hypothetical protein